MGLTEGHLLSDEGGAWEPIGGWPDKPNLSVHPQPVCCQSLFPQGGFKYPRKEYIALLDVMYQAIDDYKEAADELKELQKLDEGEPQRTIIVDHYHTVLEKIEQRINFLAWVLAEISEVRDDEC